jgi:hypothetical protein
MVHADHLDVGEIGEGQIGANLKPFSELLQDIVIERGLRRGDAYLVIGLSHTNILTLNSHLIDLVES